MQQIQSKQPVTVIDAEGNRWSGYLTAVSDVRRPQADDEMPGVMVYQATVRFAVVD